MKRTEIKNIFCVALMLVDDGFSSAICKKECSVEELDALKKDSDIGNISLYGWLPYEFYHGGDVREDDENFVNYY